MDLDDRTILQVNATMMTGIFIFLSLSASLFGENIFDSNDQLGNQTRQPDNYNNLGDTIDMPRFIPIIQIMITIFLLIPFASSTATVINGNLDPLKGESPEQYRQLSLKVLRDGFWILIIGLTLIALLHTLTLIIDLMIGLYNVIVP